MSGRSSRSDRTDPADPAAGAAELLYAAPLATFTAERKRLADELRAAGAGEAAEHVAKLGKPSVSAWVVNRLYRDARPDVDALLHAGRRMRAGDVAATRDQRAVLARLHQRAALALRAGGHAASPAMLRRVTTTLQALSAIGSFDPDPPGQLVEDRDPPGFDLLAGVTVPPRRADADRESRESKPARSAARRSAAAAPAREAPPAPDPAELRREQRAAAQLKLLERSAAQAHRRVDTHARQVADLKAEFALAEAKAERLRAALNQAEQALAEARAAADAAARAVDQAQGSSRGEDEGSDG